MKTKRCRKCGTKLIPGKNWAKQRGNICYFCNNAPLKERRQRYKAKIDEIKCETGCVVCRENRSACLDFHAPDGHTEKCISRMVRAGTSWLKIEAEIKRCVVVCANCHRLIHAGEIKL